MVIKPKLSYLVTSNFKPITGGDKDSRLRGSELMKIDKTIVWESRTESFVIEPTFDEMCIFQYLLFMSRLASKRFADDGLNNAFTEALDLGYMPILLYPLFMTEHHIPNLVNQIMSCGLKIYKKKPRKLDGKPIDKLIEDLWVSKVDVSKQFEMNPLKLKSTEVLVEILRRGVKG